ncbi:MAG: hypothetical protein ACTSXC_04690 [Candidatus Freyarchaeota archaeon]
MAALTLKDEFLDLLEKDREFRYAVLGYLGLDEVIKRMDRQQQTIQKILERLERAEEERTQIRKEQTKIWEEVRGLREEQTKIWEELRGIREEQVKLREDFNRMLGRIERLEVLYGRLDGRLGRIEATLEKLTLDIEEEARSVVGWRLREMGYEVNLGVLSVPEAEVNLYGVTDDLCVIGEATVRAGAKLIDEVVGKASLLSRKYPEKVRPKKILVVYTSWITPEAVEKAKKKGVWVVKAIGDVTPAKIS